MIFMYKHIIFDFGGVFLNLGGKQTGIPKDLARIFGITEGSAATIWNEGKEKLLTGKETPKQFLSVMSKKLGVQIDVEKAFEAWKSYNRVEKEQIDWELVEYVRQLGKNYEIHMLTNTIDLDRKSDRLVSGVESHFSNVFKSYEEGLRKPDRRAFLNVLGKIKAMPEECVFVDDFQPNVASANEIGMKGVLFTNLASLKDEFRKLGVVWH